MNSEATRPTTAFGGSRFAAMFLDADRIGVIASILCAIHCAATPVVFLVLPTLGDFWAHPASHWILALVVVPIALLMIRKGYRNHGRKWILPVGAIGIILVLVGAALPYAGAGSESASHSHLIGDGHSEGDLLHQEHGAAGHDECCPTVVESPEGTSRLSIPPSSILTTAGGLFLVAIHVGNMRCRQPCRRRRDPPVSCWVP